MIIRIAEKIVSKEEESVWINTISTICR